MASVLGDFMKSVLIAIQPKYCELIANGKKTVEVRKTKPKLDVPFKCYIYCTKDNTFAEKTLRGFDDNGKAIYYKANKGKVIGEFVCDKVYDLKFVPKEYYGKPSGTFEQFVCENSCLSFEDIKAYGKGKSVYAWHITDLVIYETPKELSEFYRECEEYRCDNCPYLYVENTPNCYETYCEVYGKIPIKRPPQSWCYVEELGV